MAKRASNSRRGRQQLLPIDYVRNRGLFSNHWFENRLQREPEWGDLSAASLDALDRLSDLWTREKGRVERYGTEAPLEQAFIQPALEILGWKLIYQTHLQGRRPDYALFTDDAGLDAALHVDRLSPEFWNHPTIVADAKAWHIPLNRPSLVNNRREYPPEQIEWYLDHSRLNFGILTNGKLWRLVPREYDTHQRRFQTYLECDLPALLDKWQAARHSITERDSLSGEFQQFYLFFSPHAYASDLPKPLITRAIEGSTEYRIGVGEGLKERAFEALRLCIEGLLRYAPNELDPERDLQQCRDASFILLFRILFIMHAEDRRLLPYRINRAYTDNRSLGRHRDEIGGILDRFQDGVGDDFADDSTEIWEDLQSLFDLVDGGHGRYGVPEYNGGLFDSESNAFLANKRIADWYLARVLDQLGRAPDAQRPRDGLFRVDYRDLAIQHLGGIYEGLLELQPSHALRELVVISHRDQGRIEEKYIDTAAPVPHGWQLTDQRYPAGAIFLKTSKDERRASGSYYTPDHIVNHIVEETVGQLCRAVSDELSREIAEEQQRLAAMPNGQAADSTRLDALKRDYDDRILRLRILDPAMGSGHFLLRVCQRLAEEIATHQYTGDETGNGMQQGESAVSFWKRRVVEHCLYGVDLNPLAVELAKLALWLETVAGDEPLSFLDHHLRHGNSLVGGRVQTMGALPGEIDLLSDRFADQVQGKMVSLLQPLQAISDLDSDSAEHVKEKERLYREFQKAREPFRLVGDLWCSALCPGNVITSEQFQDALDELGRPKRFGRLVAQEWFTTSIELARTHFLQCFHWELEFPEAFFDGGQRLPQEGFDAVIGNPPYEVLSELESGMDLTALRAVIVAEEVYAPSRGGKNNLYKLFICRALELVRAGGFVGFITPMAVLGDKITSDIRRQIMEVASFTGIDAFPQKDRPGDRVFPEAKLSTAVFTLRRQRNDDSTFNVRTHSGRFLEATPRAYSLPTADIPLYDPVNLTIATGEQADWEIASTLFATGRMARLSEFAEFFQGEVNETNERARGNLTDGAESGTLVTRGASICLYVARPASQGRDLFIDVDRFLNGKDEGSKSFHFRHRRVCWQESSPQNNFRRIIAALVPAGQFCNHKINYLPEHTSKLPLEFVLGLFNSKLADWYFWLGSSNAAVSHYQLYNLPCPVFADVAPDRKQVETLRRLLRAGKVDDAYEAVRANLTDAPFNPVVREAIVEAVKRIIDVESDRGEIRRVDRSALAAEAQPYQDFIDRLIFAMAGLSADDARALEDRYNLMV
jgi:hypothetical protein